MKPVFTTLHILKYLFCIPLLAGLDYLGYLFSLISCGNNFYLLSLQILICGGILLSNIIIPAILVFYDVARIENMD